MRRFSRVGLGLLALSWMGCSRQPREERFQVQPGAFVYVAPVTNRIVALTFDDGPNDPHTTQLLDLLAAERVPATFFIIGANAVRQPDTVRRIAREGHEIGVHTWQHPRFDEISREQRATEIRRCGDLVRALTGRQPALFRPPYGIFGPPSPDQPRIASLSDLCRELGYVIVGHTATGYDWHNKTAANMAQHLIEQTSPGAILLLHDGFEMHPAADRSRSVEAAAIALRALKSRGYRFVTVSELLAQAGPPQAVFPRGIQLLGWSYPEPHPGVTIPIRVYWHVPPDLYPKGLFAFVHLTDAGGHIMAQADHPLPRGDDMWHYADPQPLNIPTPVAAPLDLNIGLALGITRQGLWQKIPKWRLTPHAAQAPVKDKALLITPFLP